MRCERARQEMTMLGYQESPLARDVREHTEHCDACRAYQTHVQQLDRLMAHDENLEPRPGFDTRFFARLEETKWQPSRIARWRWALMGSAAVAATAAILLVVAPGPSSGELADDIALAMELELIENIEIVQKLEEIEDFELLAQLDQGELNRLITEVD